MDKRSQRCDPNVDNIVEKFYEKDFQNASQTEFMVINRKDDRLHVKWKGYNNSFSSSINIKEIL